MLFGGEVKIMKSSRVILSCLISIVLTSAASAAWISLTDPVPLSSLEGGSLTFDDKEFSGFDLISYSSGGAITPNFDETSVQVVQDVATDDYGLRFVMFSWAAGSGQTVNVDLSFKVSILPDYDDYYIKDVWMYLTGASATGTGVVNAAENVWDAFPGGNIVASLSCSKQYDDGGVYLSDHAEFAPLKEIWIQTKDISITGGTDGAAHLSEVFQFYSQIPEPATLVLLGAGGVWILSRKKRSA